MCRETGTTLDICCECADAAARGEWINGADLPAGVITHGGLQYAPISILSVVGGVAVQFARIAGKEGGYCARTIFAGEVDESREAADG